MTSLQSNPKPRLTLDNLVDIVMGIRMDIRKLKRLISRAQPTGAVVFFATGNQQDGYLICDGTTYAMADYPDLGAMLGSTFGGNGTTTFGVPNFSGGVFPLGTVGTVGSSGGTSTHTHPLSDNAQADIGPSGGSIVIRRITSSYTANFSFNPVMTQTASTATSTLAVGLSGVTNSASTMPPYLTFVPQIKI